MTRQEDENTIRGFFQHTKEYEREMIFMTAVHLLTADALETFMKLHNLKMRS